MKIHTASNMKIGILGEKKSVLAFKALGVEAFGVSNSEDLAMAMEKIKSQEFAILLITEDIAANYEKEIKPFFQATLPACLVISGLKGGSGKAKEGLEEILERALGSASFFN